MRFHEDRVASLHCGPQAERQIHIWEPSAPRAVILALHGGMSHGGDYCTPALYFRQHGIATVSYDLCGHQSQRRADIPNFHVFLDESVRFLEWTKRAYPGLPIFVMGHSMGALIATHLGLGHFNAHPCIKGFIFSSPYYVNAVKVSPLVLSLAGVLGVLAPSMKVPLASFTHQLTHDAAITERHLNDERDGIRATEITVRFGNALTHAQLGLAARLPAWKHPLFAVLAGEDRLADSNAAELMLRTLRPKLLTLQRHAHNYHENFNELNREQIYADILAWMAPRITA